MPIVDTAFEVDGKLERSFDSRALAMARHSVAPIVRIPERLGRLRLDRWGAVAIYPAHTSTVKPVARGCSAE